MSDTGGHTAPSLLEPAATASGRVRLAALPAPERRAALAEMVSAEFRQVLQMMPHETLPADESFFDLGLTSLSVEEVKQQLETQWACRVDAEVLFNHPTLAHLLAHLESGPLSDLFPSTVDPRTTAPAPPETDEKSLVDDMLARLYQP